MIPDWEIIVIAGDDLSHRLHVIRDPSHATLPQLTASSPDSETTWEDTIQYYNNIAAGR